MVKGKNLYTEENRIKQTKAQANPSLTTKLANTNPNSHTHQSSKSNFLFHLMTLLQHREATSNKLTIPVGPEKSESEYVDQLPGGGVDDDDASLRRRRRLSSAALGSPSSAAAPSSTVWNSVSEEAGAPSSV